MCGRRFCEQLVARGIPAHVGSNDSPEFVAEALREWATSAGAEIADIEPGFHGEIAIARELQQRTVPSDC